MKKRFFTSEYVFLHVRVELQVSIIAHRRIHNG